MELTLDWGITFAVIGALAAVALGGIGSSIGCGRAGQKAAGVLAEKPHMFGKLSLMVALPGSQGVYGFLIAILILLKIGAIGTGVEELTAQKGMTLMIAGLITGLTGLMSAMFQARAVSASIGGLAKDESIMGGAITMSVIVETYAIFGLLISILIWNSVN